MKKYILILDELVYSFNTEKDLIAYCANYKIEDYTVALKYYEVVDGEKEN